MLIATAPFKTSEKLTTRERKLRQFVLTFIADAGTGHQCAALWLGAEGSLEPRNSDTPSLRLSSNPAVHSVVSGDHVSDAGLVLIITAAAAADADADATAAAVVSRDVLRSISGMLD